jgi:hypothetical protein
VDEILMLVRGSLLLLFCVVEDGNLCRRKISMKLESR